MISVSSWGQFTNTKRITLASGPLFLDAGGEPQGTASYALA
jgi:hypothetical protein